jgi:peptide/nickel transport system permease protein
LSWKLRGLITALRGRRQGGRAKKKAGKIEEAESYVVASQWQLMYWKFRRHKLATVAVPVFAVLLVIAVFCEFIAPYTPTERFSKYKEAPPNGLHWVDAEGRFHVMPFVYEIERSTDPVTFKRTFAYDTAVKYGTGFFVKGSPYKLWELIPTDVHLFGPRERGAPFLLMGTDQLGRDLFTRIIYGTRVSLAFGVLSVMLTFVLGVVLGGLSGYLGGVVDNIIQRIIDLLLCIPTLPLWMALAAALPRSWDPLFIYFGMIFVMSLIGWTGLARVVRGKILSVREEDFTTAARLCGATDRRIIFKHMLPSFASYMIVNVTMSIPASILGETALSFLGLGLQAPIVSWGVLLQDAQTVQALAMHPWLLFPVAFVITTVLVFNFIGDGLRDAADPYAK